MRQLLFSLMAATTIVSCSMVHSAVVISQVYGAGGNNNSIYKNDFIELFNSGAAPVDLTGWSVQYAGSTSSSWSVAPLHGTIQPGAYYLVKLGGASGGTTELPDPDATGTFNMAATAGKVALASNSLASSGACPGGPEILDLVGFGATANCFLGTGPAPSPGATTAIFRKENGCENSGNNNSDFVTGPAEPRNSASPISPCHSGAMLELICPEDAAAWIETEGECGLWLSFSAVATGEPEPSLVYSVNGEPIEFPFHFPAGSTWVDVVASSGALEEFCGFEVLVVAPQPSLSCPPDLHVIVPPGQSEAAVAYGLPELTGCEEFALDWSTSAPSGSMFPVGTTLVSCAAMFEEQLLECGFEVTVEPALLISFPSSGHVQAASVPLQLTGRVAVFEPALQTVEWVINGDSLAELRISGSVILDGDGNWIVSDAVVLHQAGGYSISLVLKEGNQDLAETNMVNNDPEQPAFFVIAEQSQGWITGGGLVHSSADSLLWEVSAGKATFAFALRNHRRTGAPHGHFNYHFRNAKMDFRSRAFDQLVISGTEALATGTGKVNGQNCGFVLRARDGKSNGEPDQLRLQLFDQASGIPLYDSAGLGTPGDQLPPIMKGSIVLHH
jgi:hypothetical protein